MNEDSSVKKGNFIGIAPSPPIEKVACFSKILTAIHFVILQLQVLINEITVDF